MSYRCAITGKVVPPGTSKCTIVLERHVEHPYRRGANKGWVFKGGKLRRTRVNDPGGEGNQIAREIPVCPEVYRQWLDKDPEIMAKIRNVK